MAKWLQTVVILTAIYFCKRLIQLNKLLNSISSCNFLIDDVHLHDFKILHGNIKWIVKWASFSNPTIDPPNFTAYPTYKLHNSR